MGWLNTIPQGTTREITLRAPHWDSSGQVAMVERRVRVTIPPGVRVGQLIRLPGQGEPGRAGAAAGDLYLKVLLRPHPRFDVRGSTLRTDLPLAPWEAALGASLDLRLPEGRTLPVTVPADSQAGQVITLRGQGLQGATEVA